MNNVFVSLLLHRYWLVWFALLSFNQFTHDKKRKKTRVRYLSLCALVIYCTKHRMTHNIPHEWLVIFLRCVKYHLRVYLHTHLIFKKLNNYKT